jgi:hypothetical protein
LAQARASTWRALEPRGFIDEASFGVVEFMAIPAAERRRVLASSERRE